MADLSGSHFEYAGISSRTYGLITANVETTRYVNIGGEIEGVSIFNKKNHKRYLIDDDYSSSPLSLELDIVTEDGRGIEYSQRRKIEKWLFNRGQYKKFYLDTGDDCYGETTDLVDGDYKRLYLNCRFINPTRLEYNGGIVGYRVTLEADSCMWWQEPVTKTYELNLANANSVGYITVPIDSDLDDYIYPKIKITAGNVVSQVSIINTTDDSVRETLVSMPAARSSVTIYGDTGLVVGGAYPTIDNRVFPRLLDGENSLVVKGCVSSIEVTFQNRRYM